MKILHLLYESRGDYFGIGGVGVRAYEVYRFLRQRHDITLLCKKYPGAHEGTVEGLRHLFVGSESTSLTTTLLSYAYHASFYVKNHGGDYDVIIEEFSPAIPTLLHLYRKRPVVLQIQGYTGKHYVSKYNPVYSTVLYLSEKVRPKYYKYIIFVSEVTKKRFSITNATCSRIIPNGIPGELLSLTAGEADYILFLGRIDIHAKGLDVLISAYRELCRSLPVPRLVIAGQGRDMAKFKELLKRLPENVARNIELKGWVTGDVKNDVLRNALFVVFPSRYEVQPISTLEAMACGKAVIVSDIDEFNFVTGNGAGLSFKSGDFLSLAQSMQRLMEEKQREAMGNKGRMWVKDYTWEKTAMAYEGFLHEVVERTAAETRHG